MTQAAIERGSLQRQAELDEEARVVLAARLDAQAAQRADALEKLAAAQAELSSKRAEAAEAIPRRGRRRWRRRWRGSRCAT